MINCLKCGCELDSSYPFRICRTCNYLGCGITKREKVFGTMMIKQRKKEVEDNAKKM